MKFGAFVANNDLKASWEEWAEKNGAPQWSINALKKMLEERGFEGHKIGPSRGVKGLRLKVNQAHNENLRGVI